MRRAISDQPRAERDLTRIADQERVAARGHLSSDADTRILLGQAEGPERVAMARELFREYAGAIGTDLEYQGFTAEVAALPVPFGVGARAGSWSTR